MTDPFSFARDEFTTAICEALNSKDLDALEELRDGPIEKYILDLISSYRKITDWPKKDMILHLIQDLDYQRLQVVMVDALDSPTPESRAIAICYLRSDNSLFESFVVKGFVDPTRVDAEINRYRE